MGVADDLHEACSTGDVAAAQRLLEAAPALAWAQDEEAQLPQHYAAQGGHEGVGALAAGRGASSRDGSKRL